MSGIHSFGAAEGIPKEFVMAMSLMCSGVFSSVVILLFASCGSSCFEVST